MSNAYQDEGQEPPGPQLVREIAETIRRPPIHSRYDQESEYELAKALIIQRKVPRPPTGEPRIHDLHSLSEWVLYDHQEQPAMIRNGNSA